MIFGYARVSTEGQSYEAQQAQLAAAGCERVFAETASGAQADRRELAKLLSQLAQGDVVIVTRLDRLARSTRDLLNILARIGEAGASFRSLADTWADTTTPHGRLIVTVLGGLAEFEREIIKARTQEGRARAKGQGKSLGRKFKLTPHQRAEIKQRKAEGESVRSIAKSYNVSSATIGRI